MNHVYLSCNKSKIRKFRGFVSCFTGKKVENLPKIRNFFFFVTIHFGGLAALLLTMIFMFL